MRECSSGGQTAVELYCFFFSSRRRHTRFDCDWSSDVCSSDLTESDSVYAFDADNNGTGGGQLWQISFINPANGITTVPQSAVEKGTDIPIQVGIDRKSVV